jgi:hypothetical protein
VLKALTIRQPWASAIAYGAKTVENRSWEPLRLSDGDELAIHAGKSLDLGARPPDGQSWNARRPLALGAILAVATLAACHDWDECENPDGTLCTPWSQRFQWHWQITGVRALAQPVPCRGYQKIWTVPDEAEAAVREQLAAGQ